MRFYLNIMQYINQDKKFISHLVTKQFNTSQNSVLSNDSKYTGNKGIDRIIDQSRVKLFELMSIYEEAIGLREIKIAQETVLKVNQN
jgi:hypothetical protein